MIAGVCLLLSSGTILGSISGLPVAYAPFERDAYGVQPVEFRTFEYRTGSAWAPSRETYRWAEFVSGEKSVLIAGKDSRISDLGGEKRCGFGHLLIYAGKREYAAPGSDFLGEVRFLLKEKTLWNESWSTDRLFVDEKSKTFTWTRTWSISGVRGVFSYTAQSMSSGKVCVKWDSGIDDETWEKCRLDKKIEVSVSSPNDSVEFVKKDCCTWELNPSSPAKHITVSLRQNGPRGSVTINFHASSALKMPPLPQTGGVDFWNTDGYDVPHKPSRNLMTNGGFEQGWKGWRTNRCAPLSAVDSCPGKNFSTLVPDAHSGRRALKVDMLGQRGDLPAFKSAPLALEPGKPYVVSAWVRSDRKRGAGCAIVPCPEGDMVKQDWVDGVVPVTSIVVNEEWERLSVPFVASSQGTNIGVWPWGGPIWIDDVTVVEGTVLDRNEVTSDPIEAILVSADEFNYFHVGQRREMRLEFSGRSNLAGEVMVSVINFYHEEIFRHHYYWTLDANGIGVICLPELDDTELGTGVFVVRLDYSVDGVVWRDYARFTILNPLAGKHSLAGFFAQFPWFAGDGSHMYFVSGEHADFIANRMRELGIGATSWQSNDTYAKGRWAPIFHKYGIVNKHHLLQEDLRKRHPETFGWGMPGLSNFTNATPEELSFIEAEAYRSAKEADPSDVYWTYSNEEELWHPLVRARKFDTYFKYQYACYKGLKRGFDERGMTFYYAPTHGTASYRHDRAYAIMDGYLEAAARQNFRYTCIAVHTYHAIDGSILGAGNRDAGASHLIKRLAHYGYPESTPILFPEGFNILPMYIPDWGAKDWGDVYHGAIPSQSLGLREVLHAGALARMYVMDLKWYPRLKVVHPWLSKPYMDDAFTPYMYTIVMNTLGHLMPDPRYVGDVHPFPDVHAYCFLPTPTSKNAILAIWTSANDVEKGLRAGDVLTMHLPADTKFVDLMGNLREPTKEQRMSDVIKVPMTTAPLFICARDHSALLEAVENATGGVVAECSKRRNIPQLSVKCCGLKPDWAMANDVMLTNAVSGNVSATAKLAWSQGKLFLRVAVKGAWMPTLEIAFDGLADAREMPIGGFGPDDCVYQFSGNRVCRTVATNTQFRDGGASGSALLDAEIDETLIRKWYKTSDGGIWEIVLTPRFISPIRCERDDEFGMNIIISSKSGSCALAVGNDPAMWPVVVLR